MVRLRGVRVHNLRDVDVDFPRDALVAVTGVSGSGKSSLAFGTVYAEAQARYLESVAPYARRLIDQAGAPDAREITGLPPAVAFQQTRGVAQTRSTVGTVTALSNSLRLLLSRAGTYPEGAERLDSDSFSPNTPAGACPACHGLGRIHEVSENSLVPDPGLSIREKAIAAWPGAWQGKNYRDILATLGYDVDRPWRELPQADREWILFTDEQPVVTVHPQREAGRIQRPYQGTYQSARRYVLHTLATTQSAALRNRALQHAEVLPCPTCGGSKLRPEALAVTFAGANIAELAALPLSALAAELRPGQDDEVARVIVADLLARIEALTELGLGYLAMDRTTPTLSAGELQRLRLAATLRSTLFGVVYVLDEPSAGLHPDDTRALLRVLDRIREAGNSLVVVEHEPEVIRHADWLIDVGPGAGEHGGRVLHSGPLAGLADAAESVTRAHLLDPPAPVAHHRTPTGRIELRGVSLHNLVETDVDFPLGVFTAVTGVSGSGKTTLVTGVLAAAVRDHLGAGRPDEEDEPEDLAARHVREITGLEAVKRLVEVDQRPIGRTPRSNLATYTGLFDGVRKLFAATDEARARKYSAGRFSFNVDGGRCETCQGEGAVAAKLLFLPNSYAPCPVCRGSRYNPETLEIHYRGRSIADVLAMTVEEAREFFADVPAVARSLDTLRDVGLSYLTLGQPATELSGGEAQRIKLASELQRTRRGRTLFVLDEPTTGLHPADVEVLMRLLHALVDAGNTVVVIEHDMSVAAAADHVIDLGPGGGDEGGAVVAAGTPAEVARAETGRTAPYLREALG
ncbi:excinuclease ABC subunit A [Saccharopolyspora kobensis]|uniref:UvrABC system protein A n=2 Tax=Saccharopolyspora kobensis TaxID=146035 RepID=A0A1H5ZXX6_9PSEU|nr:excinuclease ABC subunit A [Saccharopolyspora kobensis]SFE15005.1 excinuclease ABC subunit A [Saccharopolyspora kobensis]